MHRTRRSGRIAKEVPILLLGTDTLGKVFAEETHTVVLSRHGAGIVSKNRLAPDGTLTLRMPDGGEEAEIRLVGQIGGDPGRYVYGVAFVNPQLEFWPVEFPPPEPQEQPAVQVQLECMLCGDRREFAQRDIEIEEDVYNVNGYVLRFCQTCGTTTRWKRAEGGPLQRSAPDDVVPAPDRSATPAKTTAMQRAQQLNAERTGVTASALGVTSLTTELFVPLNDPPEVTSASARLVEAPILATPVGTPKETPAPAVDSNGRRVNRRRHLRVRVNFNACVRHVAHGDEIVECENVSKGGLCFHSRRQYSADSFLEIAAPYSPGEPALFTIARITRVESLGGEVFRYGVAYMK